MAFFKPRLSLKRSQKKRKNKGQEGQLVVEYVLLLAVVATIGMLMITLMIGREDGKGLIIQKWAILVDTVSKDLPDN